MYGRSIRAKFFIRSRIILGFNRQLNQDGFRCSVISHTLN
ncbi:hypothetical protein MC7420_3940 [Coleofasciculus chthonoplastes PCC 7420]|uniref:Uncharacterized protein n=1 Tax=Coleofasciculus chthonoplastes PCC 7420 TaxID=118168 RepID=B4VUF0_9CYAN|nr:hypothetical protein MC7420_3940 [Coleofasciculus chthonoplastes PCC 7420]